ncbi:MAG: response regulator [Kamptonema sp. SIO4C4]|nr:response regulator [Kamptonema sp. SIO4C4]
MKTALLVEDGATDREFMSRCLKEVGLMVVSTTNVEEAQNTIASQRPDVIFLDVILPGQSGFEFCRELKVNPDTKNIPVIICSTKGTEVDKTWGTMLGADGYLAKPIDPQELQKTVRQFIS